jgi:hypothetical protein
MESRSSSLENNSCPKYIEVWHLDELEVVENIRQGEVCWVCVEYLYELG